MIRIWTPLGFLTGATLALQAFQRLNATRTGPVGAELYVIGALGAFATCMGLASLVLWASCEWD